MNYALRTFNKADAQGVKDLILSILASEYPFDKSAYSDSDLDKVGEVYGGDRDTFIVIEEEGQIVGTVGVKGETAEDVILRRLFVNLKHRKKGYGTELLKKAVAFCRSKGYKRIFFRCTDRMSDAMNLCLKNDFREAEALEVSGFKIHKLELDI